MIRRVFLILFFLLAPPLLAIAFYFGSKYWLAATDRVIEESTLDYIVLGGIVILYFLAFLEVKARWSHSD
jgi:hypothetical protein